MNVRVALERQLLRSMGLGWSRASPEVRLGATTGWDEVWVGSELTNEKNVPGIDLGGGESGEGCAGFGSELADVGSGGDVWVGVGESVVDLAGNEAFEAAHDFFAGFVFGGAAFDVSAGSWVVTHANQHDGEQCPVGSPVAATVETMAAGFS